MVKPSKKIKPQKYIRFIYFLFSIFFISLTQDFNVDNVGYNEKSKNNLELTNKVKTSIINIAK